MSSRRQVLSVPSQPTVSEASNSLSALSSAPKTTPPYPIYVVTYSRGSLKEPGGMKPYHWVFLIQAHKDSHRLHKGIVHQLRGVPGDFHYQGDESAYSLRKLGKAIDKIEVGSVHPSKMYRVAEVLNRVSIVNDKNSRWNCQDWSTKGLELLRMMEIVGDRQKYM